MVLASSISLTLTHRSERALVSSVVSQSWLGVHLAQTFVALQRDAFPSGGGDRFEQTYGSVNGGLLILAAERAGP